MRNFFGLDDIRRRKTGELSSLQESLMAQTEGHSVYFTFSKKLLSYKYHRFATWNNMVLFSFRDSDLIKLYDANGRLSYIQLLQ